LVLPIPLSQVFVIMGGETGSTDNEFCLVLQPEIKKTIPRFIRITNGIFFT
jgi:hypothetical protein